jgi:hypothetical protein
LWNLFLEEAIPWEGITDLHVCGGKGHHIGQHISTTQSISWQLSARDEKSIPALKINI